MKVLKKAMGMESERGRDRQSFKHSRDRNKIYNSKLLIILLQIHTNGFFLYMRKIRYACYWQTRTLFVLYSVTLRYICGFVCFLILLSRRLSLSIALLCLPFCIPNKAVYVKVDVCL